MNIVDRIDAQGRTYRFYNVNILAMEDGMSPKHKNRIMDDIMRECESYTIPGAGTFFATILDTKISVSAKRTTKMCPYWKIYFD